MVNEHPVMLVVIVTVAAILLLFCIGYRREIARFLARLITQARRDMDQGREFDDRLGGQAAPGATQTLRLSQPPASNMDHAAEIRAQMQKMAAEITVLRTQIQELRRVVESVPVTVQKLTAEAAKPGRTPAQLGRTAAVAAGQSSAIELPGVTQLIVNIHPERGAPAQRSLKDQVMEAFQSGSGMAALEDLEAKRVLVANSREVREGFTSPEFMTGDDGDLLLICETDSQGWLAPRPGPLSEFMHTGIKHAFDLENYVPGYSYQEVRLISPAKVIRTGERWRIADRGKGKLELLRAVPTGS
jgi:hypothetical protein